MDIDVRRLHLFMAVADELHFSRAAKRLHVSQPLLSQQIRALEKELGTQLFTRSSRVVELTAAGQALMDATPRVLYELQRATVDVEQAANGVLGRLLVGSVRTALAGITPSIMRALRTEHPELRIDLANMETAAQLQALADKRIDVGIVRATTTAEDLILEPLTADPLVAVFPQDHPLAGMSAIEPAQLAAEPFITWPRHLNADFYDILIAYCREHGFSPHIAAEGGDIDTQLAFVAAGIGISLQPSFYATAGRSDVAFRPLHGTTPHIELRLARRKETNPAVQHFVDAARRVASE
ncbi:LysR substrate-binding domain-containing protein [Sciscionella sediminilitoris]|uniref:LysR substrate-binding domain-containing protein n=1 Tax=Sciscionella sediminilitoris TaxID=1445613 RepID=UPI000690E103|nr:LysR substrate-binding domain-containing protein [Sciscionella sp. SE31]